MTEYDNLTADSAAAVELSVLLSEPVRATDVPLDQVVGLLDKLAAYEGRCHLMRAILTARLTTQPARSSNARGTDQLVDDIGEVANIARRSVSWIRKHGHELPGFHQPGGKGSKVAWSRQALLAWVASDTPQAHSR